MKKLFSILVGVIVYNSVVGQNAILAENTSTSVDVSGSITIKPTAASGSITFSDVTFKCSSLVLSDLLKEIKIKGNVKIICTGGISDNPTAAANSVVFIADNGSGGSFTIEYASTGFSSTRSYQSRPGANIKFVLTAR